MEVAQSITSKKNRIGDIRSDLSIYTPRKNEQNTEQVAEVSDTEKLIAAQNKKTQELIAAQNKTTHAVRSLAITFVAAPVITFAVLIVIALSVSTGNITFIILTAISAIVICVYVLIAALTELGKSKVD
jgi:cytochrome c-type biogenesis protein CcmH/NrfG